MLRWDENLAALIQSVVFVHATEVDGYALKNPDQKGEKGIQ